MTNEPYMQLLICCTFLLAFAAPAIAARDHEWTTALSRPPAPIPVLTPTPALSPAPAVAPASPRTPTPALAPAPTPASAPDELTWNVEYILWAPECKAKVMIGINGHFPGPTITAKAGDRIIVTVNNKLHTEGLVIHWHGMKQIGTPWADGTASISQCPIDPGETFTYNFTADKPGTYFYHGHFGMQRAAGLYGSLIVNATEDQPEPYEYDDGHELSMLLSDWYHDNVYAQVAGLDRKVGHFEWIGEPQTILINGRGQYGCTLYSSDIKGMDTCDRKKDHCGFAAKEAETEAEKKANEKAEKRCVTRSECGPFCEKTQCAPVVFNVEAGKKYRLRIASTTSLSALNVQVQGHELTVVEADGNPVKPFTVKDIDISSGESYSVILETKHTTGSYWISVGVRGREPKTPAAAAILKYTDSESEWPAISTLPETPAWDDEDHTMDFAKGIKSLQVADAPELKRPADRTIVMLNTQTLIDGHVRWSINNISLTLPATPYLGAYYYGLQDAAFDAAVDAPDNFPTDYNIEKPPTNNTYPMTHSNRVYKLQYGHVVDVVLQNANMLSEGSTEAHPWHLHGHDFWLLGYGDGRYSSSTAAELLNLENPPLRNTVMVFPHGWTAIRFVADNTGAWAFHCHIEPHLHMGMGAVFVEGIEKMQDLQEVPMNAMMCGVVKSRELAHLSPATLRSPAPAAPPAP